MEEENHPHPHPQGHLPQPRPHHTQPRGGSATTPRQGRPSSSSATQRHQHPNPFAGGNRLNFPPLERALREKDESHDADNESSVSPPGTSDSLDLSMDARAALAEHLRHVAKYGLDGDGDDERQAATRQQRQRRRLRHPPPTTATTTTGDGRGLWSHPTLSTEEEADDLNETANSSFDTTPLLNTLDEEWEAILQGGGGNSSPSVVEYSSSSPAILPTFSRLQVMDSAGDGEEIEVAVMEMTYIEASEENEPSEDYFNSSKVWQLMTPEKNRHRLQEAVTDRHPLHDSQDCSDDEEGNTPESACLVGGEEQGGTCTTTANNNNHHTAKNPRFSISPRASPPSSYASSPIALLDDDGAPSEISTAASAWHHSPSLRQVASVAITDFATEEHGPGEPPHNPTNSLLAAHDIMGVEESNAGGAGAGLHNSLLHTSIHEDLPLITAPFEAIVPDPEGSFADWSVQSPEHSFTLPASMTPIRPLPPLSPIHNLRGSPSSSHRGSSGSSGSGSGSHHHAHPRGGSGGGGSSSSSHNHRSRGSSARSSASSSSGRSWRLPVNSPHRSEPDFGMRQDPASPILASLSPERPPHSASNPAESWENEADPFSLPDEKPTKPWLSSAPLVGEVTEQNVKSLEGDSSSSDAPSRSHKKAVAPAFPEDALSPLAAQAAQAAAMYLQTHQREARRRPSSKHEWPATGELALAPTESFESSTVGLVDSQLSVHRVTGATTASGTLGPPDKDGLTAPLLSLDSIDSDGPSSEHSRGTTARTTGTRSVEDVGATRRNFRSVVPRRILFPTDGVEGNVKEGDSFDRGLLPPSQSF